MDIKIIDPQTGLARIGSYYDDLELGLALRYIRPVDRVLLAGAGLGASYLLLVNAIGPDNVIAYEANEKLCAMFNEQNLVGICPINHAALRNFTGETEFYVSDRWIGSSVLQDHTSAGVNATRIDVPCFALDEVIAQHNITYLFLDVEGAEFELLSTSQLTTIRGIVVELHGSQRARDAILETLSHLGFIQQYVISFENTEEIGIVVLEREL